jgi:hypothetical protein
MATGTRREAFPDVLATANPAGYNTFTAYPHAGETPVSVGYYWEPDFAGDNFQVRALTVRISSSVGDAYEVGGIFEGDGTLYIDTVFLY